MPGGEPRGASASSSDEEAASTEAGSEEEGGEEERRQAKAPWHFKFIVFGSVIYLGWRAYQGVEWLIHHV